MIISQAQQQVLKYGVQGRNISVNSAPGSGKSFILKRLARELPDVKGIALSFNNSTAKEAKKGYPKNFEVFTSNALALDRMDPGYSKKLGTINAWDIVDWLNIQPSSFSSSISMGFYVLQTLNNFCNSADEQLDLSHAPDIFDVNEEMTRQTKYNMAVMAAQIFEMAVDLKSSVPVTHNIYLKEFQLNKPQLGYDTLFLDEAQDTNPVVWDIIKNQVDTQIVLVGDQFQQLNRFRGAMNVMDMLPNAKHVNMNISWRFGNAIAAVANTLLDRHFAVDYRVEGNPEKKSKVGRLTKIPNLHLYRSNLGLLSGVLDKTLAGHKVNVVGGVSEMKNLIHGCSQLKSGKRSNVSELSRFRSWDEFVSFTETKAGRHMKKFKNASEKYDTSQLISALDSAEKPQKGALLFSTAHKAKGLEAESCFIGNDFIGPDDKRYTLDESNVLYVAVTRGNCLDETNVRGHITTYSNHYKEQKVLESEKQPVVGINRDENHSSLMEFKHEEIDISPDGVSPF